MFFVSSCAWIPSTAVTIALPPEPQIVECPAPPNVEAHIVESNGVKSVIMPYTKAEEIRNWMHDYPKCMQSNEVLLKAHIQKLENRIKAVNGG
jgi:hypothetical protein